MNNIPTRKEDKSDSELLKELQDAIGMEADVIPKGFRTSSDWAKVWQLSESHTRHLLLGGIASGKLIRRQFRLTKGGKLVFYYARK